MMQLSLYDFDGTLYRGDATRDFWKYCFKKYWWQAYKLPWQLLVIVLWYAGCVSTERVKEVTLSIMNLDHLEQDIIEFWQQHKKNIFPWVADELTKDKAQGYLTICISASPNFLLEPIVHSLNIDYLICTRMEGKCMVHKNCSGTEKVERLKQWADKRAFKVVKMTSDARVDLPLYAVAHHKFWVNKMGIRQPGTPPI